MRTQDVVAFAVAGLLVASAPVAAQAQGTGAWSVSFDVGLDSSMSGDIYDRSQGNLSGQPVQISARPYSSPGLAWSVGIGRSLSDRIEFRVRVAGTSNSNDRQHTGRVGIANINGSVFSELDKLTEFGLDLGLRAYWLNGRSVQPYVGGFVGFARVSAISGSFDSPDATFVFDNDLDLYADSTAAAGGASMGLLFNRSDSFGWYVNFDIRWRGNLKGTDTDLAGTNLETLNNSGSRINSPLSVGARFRL